MAFSIYTFSNSVKNLVHKNNTTTSGFDISAGLLKRVSKITMGYHEDKPVANISYPAVWVEPKRKAEMFTVLGPNAMRTMTADFDIIGIVDSGLGAFDGREQSDGEMLKLGANLETLFRNYIDLSNTTQGIRAMVTSSEYDIVESNDTYNSIVKLNLEIKIRSD